MQSALNADSLKVLGNLIQHGMNDSIRIAANGIFQEQMRNLLMKPGVPDLDSVKNISVLNSPDRKFNLITWQLPSYEGSYTFFGFIRIVDKKKPEPKVIDLVDSTYRITQPENAKLNADKWYGAVYYKILVTKKGEKNYYTLLGWKGNNPISTQKVIDVLYFSGDKPAFGFPLFKKNNVYQNRVIFEYSAQAVMSLRYDENKKMIVFDHLSSGVPGFNGPDGTYNAFRFKNGRWELLEDVDVNTGFTPKSVEIKPIKDDEIKRK